jgi:hypothetical protein
MAAHQRGHLEHFRGSGMTLETWLEIARANLATRADPIRFGERNGRDPKLHQ